MTDRASPPRPNASESARKRAGPPPPLLTGRTALQELPANPQHVSAIQPSRVESFPRAVRAEGSADRLRSQADNGQGRSARRKIWSLAGWWSAASNDAQTSIPETFDPRSQTNGNPSDAPRVMPAHRESLRNHHRADQISRSLRGDRQIQVHHDLDHAPPRGRSMNHIGTQLGGRDHTTIPRGMNRMGEFRETDNTGAGERGITDAVSDESDMLALWRNRRIPTA